MASTVEDVETWCNTKHGNVDFYLTQLSGYGCFMEYLYKYSPDKAEMCSYCDSERENTKHVFFLWPQYETERKYLEPQIFERLTPENLVLHMLRSKQA